MRPQTSETSIISINTEWQNELNLYEAKKQKPRVCKKKQNYYIVFKC